MDAKNDINSLPACPVETTLTLIGSKWKVLILRDLIDGKKRFGELKRSVAARFMQRYRREWNMNCPSSE